MSELERILNKLRPNDANVLEFLAVFEHKKYDKHWQLDTRLYQAFGKKLISGGHPNRAFELIRRGLVCRPHDRELLYLRALALAKGGNISKAHELAYELLKRPRLKRRLQVEAVSLLGRLEKDRYEWTDKPSLKRRYAKASAQRYEQAFRLSGNSFPGINAATMFLLAGQTTRARNLATRVIKTVEKERRQRGSQHDYWSMATLGEAHLILGQPAEAAAWYRKAVRRAAGKTGDIASMSRQVRLLARKYAPAEELYRLFGIGRVIVFAGHMIDHPDRTVKHNLPPRFPPNRALERRVSIAIRTAIEQLDATIGFCSAACGSDLLFASQMLERGKELHVVLPFAKKDFYHTSVDFGLGEWSRWRRRFAKVLGGATDIHYATTEPFLEDDILFEFVNTVTQGLAITRAARLGTEPYALVVSDSSSSTRVGGTAYFLDRWNAGNRKSRVIDLQALRATVNLESPPRLRATKPARTEPTSGKIKRQVKAMLFADVKNYSQLLEEQSPAFFVAFLNEIARLIKRSNPRPVCQNTWGDALYAVFDRVSDCANFAMRLLDGIEKADFEAVGLPEDTTVRVGLHVGPVYQGKDPVIGRMTFFGSHVSRAARIEPITPPGCVFTSEQFAAALAVEPQREFVCAYAGFEEFAKGYDRCPVYRLLRR